MYSLLKSKVYFLRLDKIYLKMGSFSTHFLLATVYLAWPLILFHHEFLGIASYPELLQTFQPRPIVTEAQYDHTVTQMNELLDVDELTADEQDLLTLLGTPGE